MVSKFSRRAAAAVISLAFCWSAPRKVADKLVDASMASGIATDADGYVYLVFMDGSAPALRKVNSSGQQIFQASLSGADPCVAAGRLVYDRALSSLWYLSPCGRILSIRPQDGQAALLADLKDLTFETAKALDVTQGVPQPFTGQVQPQQAAWGDISVLWPQNAECDLFVTGVSVTTSFTARMRFSFSQGRFQAIGNDVVLASQAAGSAAAATGVAADPRQGLVWTTLPMFAYSPRSMEHLISFAFDLGLRDGVAPAIFEGMTSSRGISVDGSGGVYVVTGPDSASACRDADTRTLSPGSLFILLPDLHVGCISFGTTADSQATALSPDGKTAYITLRGANEVEACDLDLLFSRKAGEQRARTVSRSRR